MSKCYAIVDLDGYATDMRSAAANALVENGECADDLNEYISIDQIKNLIEDECCGHDDNGYPVLTESINEIIFDEIAVWIHEVGLARLCSKDLLECAWDDKENAMVFWKKESPKNEKERKPRKRSRKNKESDK